MRSGAIVSLVIGVLFCASGTAQESSAKNERHEDIRRLLELTEATKMAEQAMDQMIEQFRKGTPQTPQEFWEKFRSELSSETLVEQLVPIYEAHLSAEDVKGLIVFYESPLGQRLIQAQPKIMTESMAVGQKWGQEAAQRAIQRLQAKEQY